MWQSFHREVEILQKFPHPAIVPFIGFHITPNFGYVYLKAMPLGSLSTVIQKQKSKLDITRKLIITYGISASMEYLHANSILHRDLKPGNVLLSHNFHPKVADFGTAKSLQIISTLNFTFQETTAFIMAPEYISEPLKYKETFPIDVFSYAMTLSYMCTGIQPYARKHLVSIIQDITKGERPSLSSNSLPSPIKKLISECWSESPEARPTFTTIISRLKSDEIMNLPKIDQQKYQNYIDKLEPFHPNSDEEPDGASLTAMQSSSVLGDSFGYISTNSSQEIPLIDVKGDGIDAEDKFQLAVNLYNEAKVSNNWDQPRGYFIQVVADDTVNAQMKAEAEYFLGKISFKQGHLKCAESSIRSAVVHGHWPAHLYLANKVMQNKFSQSSSLKVDQLYKLAADHLVIKAIRKYADFNYYVLMGQSPNTKAAIEYYEKGAESGDSEMMYLGANRKEFGIHVEPDIETAMEYLMFSADKSYIPSQLRYGLYL